MAFSEQTLALFAKEVAKYPPEQKQSAVMACLAIVQHEQGHVSMPGAPIWILGLTTEPNDRRPSTKAETQNTGERSW